LKHLILLFTLMAFLLFSCRPQLVKPAVQPAPQIRILLAKLSSPDSILLKGTFELKSEEADYELAKNNKILHIVPLKNHFKIYTDNRSFHFFPGDRITVRPVQPKNIFVYRHKNFSGQISFSFVPPAGLNLINKTNLELYLQSVVSAEMPSGKTSYAEALKAQAICARTYALKKMTGRRNKSFDVYADQRDQVYNGLTAANSLAVKAVKKTRGDVLMYHDSLATVFFHSTCGGISEKVDNVWPDIKAPYLQVQKDLLGKEFACSASPYYRWQRRFSLHQMDSLLQVNFHYSLLKRTVKDTTTFLFKAKILQRSSGGRVQKMRLSFGDSTIYLAHYQIRHFFSAPSGKNLPSLLFKIKTIHDSLLVFEGGGYGHGVGLCQWGALQMSEKGFKYYDILVNKYFKGTYLKKMY